MSSRFPFNKRHHHINKPPYLTISFANFNSNSVKDSFINLLFYFNNGINKLYF